jgi:alanine racemase
MSYSTSLIEIKTDALSKNIKFIKTLIEPNVIICAVVKGNAYGHGIHIVLPILEDLGIHHFSVYSSPEAKAAFYAKTKSSTIIIMGFIDELDYKWVVKNEIEFYISGLEELQKAIKTAKVLKKKAIVHIDLETGMNRTGLTIANLKKAIPIIQDNLDVLEIKGFTTHLAGAESIANYKRIKKQLTVYKKRVKLLQDKDINAQIQHVASSAATITYPETRMDMVRVGILLYGYWPTRETFIQYIHRKKDKSNPISRAIRWSSEIISIKLVPEGEFVGYGMSFQAQQPTIIAIIPVGYYNGYSRSLSNNSHILINGQKADVIGSVNMNMILCDISHIPNVKIGDKVILIGQQGENEITFSSFAEMNNSMNYEILARLPENIKRKLVKA